MTSTLPRVAVTMGDPTGIGPEIIAKALSRTPSRETCCPIVIGDLSAMRRAVSVTGAELRIRTIREPGQADTTAGSCNLIDLAMLGESGARQGSAEAGRAACGYLERATQLALQNEVAGIVTAPLNKEALSRAGWIGVGHTELLADFCGVPRDAVTMMLASSVLRVAHVSTHVSLLEAIRRVQPERIVTVTRLVGEAAYRMLGRAPRIAVAGLNPHAGEHGLFGEEERQSIAPAVQQMVAEGWQVSGPVPPDTVFLRATKGEFDAVVAMYHDQGHIPSKLVGFHDTVNVTLGLPIIRTSVDHGTAYDIAGTGEADETNLLAAISICADMARRGG